MFETEDEKREAQERKEAKAKEKTLAEQKVQDTRQRVLAHSMGVKIEDKEIFTDWLKKKRSSWMGLLAAIMGLLAGIIIGYLIHAVV